MIPLCRVVPGPGLGVPHRQSPAIFPEQSDSAQGGRSTTEVLEKTSRQVVFTKQEEPGPSKTVQEIYLTSKYFVWINNVTV